MPISSTNTTVLYGKIAMAAYLRNVTPRFAQDMADASVLSSTSKVYFRPSRTTILPLTAFSTPIPGPERC